MTANRPSLRRIVTPHPLVMVATLIIAGLLIGLALSPAFHPPILGYAAAAVALIALNSLSMAQRARLLKQREKPGPEISLNIDSPGR